MSQTTQSLLDDPIPTKPIPSSSPPLVLSPRPRLETRKRFDDKPRSGVRTALSWAILVAAVLVGLAAIGWSLKRWVFPSVHDNDQITATVTRMDLPIIVTER